MTALDSVATGADTTPLAEWALAVEDSDVVAAVEELVLAHLLLELLSRELGEAPVLRLDNQLTSRELHKYGQLVSISTSYN